MLKLIEDKDKYELVFSGEYTNIFNRYKKSLGSKFDKLIFKYNTGFFTQGKIVFYKFMLIEFYVSVQMFLELNGNKGLGRKHLYEILELIKGETYVNLILNGIDKSKIKDTLNYKNVEKEMKFKPLQHQSKAMSEYILRKNTFNLKGVYIDGEVGSGKTFVSLAISLAVNAKRVIIVTPLKVKGPVWEFALREELFKKEQSVYVYPSKAPYNNEKYILVHYEVLRDFVKHDNKYLIKESFLIVDEAHNFNRTVSIQSESLIELGENRNITNTILMSGTAIKAEIKELEMICIMLDNGANYTTMKRLKAYYKNPNAYVFESAPLRFSTYKIKMTNEKMTIPNLYEIDVPLKVDNPEPYLLVNVKEEMQSYIKERLVDINTFLPEIEIEFEALIDKYIEIMVDKGVVNKLETVNYRRNLQEIRNRYIDNARVENLADILKDVKSFENIMISYMVKSDKIRFNNIKSMYKYPILVALGEALGNVVTKRRMEASVLLAVSYNYDRLLRMTDKKILIFSNYINTCREIEKILNKKNRISVGVYGDKTNQANGIIKEFKTNDKIRYLITTYKSLSTGVPIVEADRLLAFDMPFRNYIWSQSTGRIHRIGQGNETYAYKVFMDTGDEPNITTRTIDILEWSREMSEFIMGSDVEITDSQVEDTSLGFNKYIELNNVEGVLEKIKSVFN